MLGVPIATVRRWRLVKQGPTFLKLARSVHKYRTEDVLRWLETLARRRAAGGGPVRSTLSPVCRQDRIRDYLLALAGACAEVARDPSPEVLETLCGVLRLAPGTIEKLMEGKLRGAHRMPIRDARPNLERS
jgi:hypothetical protein